MEPISLILAALLVGATAAAKNTTSVAVKIAYESLKALIKKKFDKDTLAQSIVDAKPEEIKQAEDLLKAKMIEAGIDKDEEILKAAQAVIKREHIEQQKYFITGLMPGSIAFQGNTKRLNSVDFSENDYENYYIAEFNFEETRDSETIIDDLNNSTTSQFSSFLLRYPNLDCPDKVLLNQRFSLTVELLIEQPEEQPKVKALMIEIEDKQADLPPEIEVVLSASGFDIKGSNTQIIQVERDDESNVRFVLIPSKLGQHKIKVQFYQNGKPIGKAVRNILVSEQSVTTEVPQPDQPTELELNNGKIPPQDLELFIELDDDGCTLSFFLHSVKEEISYRRAKVGKVTLKGSPLEKMQSIYEKMNQYAKTKPTTTEGEILAEKRIEDVGNDLWEELIPDKLKQEYWKFKDRVKSIMINSDEPWIPWEMLKPLRYNDEGEREDDLFWCQQFSVSRWLSGAGTIGEFDIKTVRPMAPRQENLPSLKDEMTFLEQLSSLRPNINSLAAFNTPTQVLDSLRNEDSSIIHFACHGAFDSISPNDSAIKLSDGSLYPSDIRVRFGGKRQRPLIFINACHGGRTEFNFTGLGGWADRLLDARAGAFIGAMWEVSDRLSLQFTKTFYTALIQDNKTIADAFRQAREVIRREAPYNSTWLAYTLYADPEGKVKP
jgi:hypothetical protein